MKELTPNEVAATVQQFNDQHATLNYIEDISMLLVMATILVYIIVTDYLDNKKTVK